MTYKISIEITVKERLALYEKTRTELINSSEKAMKHMVSTGIYTEKGNLKKIYR